MGERVRAGVPQDQLNLSNSERAVLREANEYYLPGNFMLGSRFRVEGLRFRV